ncbi:MAG TPA: DUF397 domain-containing protein [Pseudonocardiaceae bacterium]|jgi:hypothetical protein|nr:DUF397 domain-containing protein [Pseudonocardiaceae bacterium]
MITPDFSRAQWRKSSYSGSNGGECVEVAATSTVVGVRDSKNATGPLMAVPAASWQRFLTRLG